MDKDKYQLMNNLVKSQIAHELVSEILYLSPVKSYERTQILNRLSLWIDDTKADLGEPIEEQKQEVEYRS